MIMVTGIILAIALYAQSHQPANAELTLTGSSLRQIISLDRLGVFAGFLVLAVGGSATGLVRRGFSMQWLRFFGKYSYALYVFHYMLLPAFNRYLPMHKMSDLFHSFVIGAFVSNDPLHRRLADRRIAELESTGEAFPEAQAPVRAEQTIARCRRATGRSFGGDEQRGSGLMTARLDRVYGRLAFAQLITLDHVLLEVGIRVQIMLDQIRAVVFGLFAQA